MTRPNANIEDQLRSRFAAPLGPGADRRIVIWHDDAGEFETEFDTFAESDAWADASERPIRFVKPVDGTLFATKMLIAREDLDSDFLIYRKRTSGDIEGDWLADIELYGESFQADYLSMLIEELGAEDTNDVRSALSRLSAFFGSKERKRQFMELVPHPSKGSDITIGVLAVLLGSLTLRSEDLVRRLAISMDQGGTEDALAPIVRFDMEEAFGRYLSRITGYQGDLHASSAFIDHVLLSAFADTVPREVMGGLEGSYSTECSTFCMSIVHDWMESDEAERDALYHALRDAETRHNLDLRFRDAKSEALAHSDIFPKVDEMLLARAMQAMVKDSDSSEDYAALLDARRDFLWARRQAKFYALVEAAASMKGFHQSHRDGFHSQTARDAFESYKREWWRMDFSYRKLCEAYQGCVAADNETLIDDAQRLMEWGNNLYINWFLARVNEDWIAHAAPSLEKSGYVEGIPLQRRFFADVVAPELKKVKRVAVIISDALRYAVGCQLKELLERKTRNTVTLSAMQATFPTITSMGMASMLPHTTLRLAAAGSVQVDGMPTVSTEQRQKVLEAAVPGSRAVQSSALFAMSSQERKQLVADAPVTYIYHNAIDAMGEKAATQSKVFDACEEAVEDVFGLAKMLIGSMGVSRVIVTADHGFVYTDRPLPEADRISSLEVGEGSYAISERYALVDAVPDGGLFAKVDMSMVSDEPLVGVSPRGFAFIKQPGGGRYAHGGLTLQEMCVPVLHLKAAGAKSEDSNLAQDAQLQLLDTNRRITSMLVNVRLYQPQPLSGQIAPCRYELMFVDKAGNAVSDVRHVSADRESDEPTERQLEARFSLKEGIAYSASEPYYLVARKEGSGEQAWREEFSIDIAFAPAEDFGF